MALTRKFLSALGIDADKVDEIIGAHAETVDALKAERDGYKADADMLQAVRKELDELKEATGKDPYKVKFEALKEEFDSFRAETGAKEKRAKTEAAYRALLREAGIPEKRIEAVLRVSDLSKAELAEDGTLVNAAALAEGIRTEWSDFIPTSEQKGADTAKPPVDKQPDYDGMSDADYYKATYEAKKG